ncbi:MAG TPA: hypothetical protein VIM08_02045 [Arthrobacter sp.]|jgi:hypothetical protein
MNLQSFGRKIGQKLGRTAAGPGATSKGGDAGTGEPRAAAARPGTTNQAVLGHFTVRDLTVFAATLILFAASLMPIIGGRFNLWNAGSLFFLGLGILLPVIVSALFAARRLSPATKIRIGSLSVDQFASVVASFTVAFFFLTVSSAYMPSLLVGLIGSLVLFAATVLGRFVPFFAGDFLGRDESPAHIVARASAVPLPRPQTPKVPKPATDTTSAERTERPAASGASTPAPTHSGSSALHTGPFAVATTGASSASAAAEAPEAPSAAPAGGAPATAAAVSSAPEMAESTAAGDPFPATRAADVVPPASSARTSEETRPGEIPTAAPAPGPVAAAGTAARASEPVAATAVHQQVRSQEPIGATVDPASRPEESHEPQVHEAFWFAVAQHRTAVDPKTGVPAFVIEPGGWVLALEDRGDEFLVQHTDGRVGVLRDLSNIERG